MKQYKCMCSYSDMYILSFRHMKYISYIEIKSVLKCFPEKEIIRKMPHV